MTLPLLCLQVAEMLDASLFIAALSRADGSDFIQGSWQAQHRIRRTVGQFFNLTVFFLFGMLVMRGWSGFTTGYLVYAVLSVTVLRMLPVAISLIGTRLSRATVLFMGWFGPRGLASIVLGLVYLEQDLRFPRRNGNPIRCHGPKLNKTAGVWVRAAQV